MDETAPSLNWFGRLYVWATHRLYSELAWAYDLAAWLVSLGQWDRWRKQALDFAQGARVLELGFGTGELLLEMARREVQGVGLEPSPTMQAIARRKMGRQGLFTPRVQAAAQAMPFADGSFDTIISTFPADYIASPATLREVARLLREPAPSEERQAGRLVIIGLHVYVHSRALRWLSGLLFGGAVDGPLPAFARLASAAGFRLSEVPLEGRWLSPSALILVRDDRAGELQGGHHGP